MNPKHILSLQSIAVLLLLAGAGCTSRTNPGTDDARVVARIIARTAPAALAFKDQSSAQQIISALDTSEHFSFGVILDSERKPFASYFRADQLFEKEKFLAQVIQSAPKNNPEAVIMDHELAIAMVRMELSGQTIGYVAIGRK
jgi:hypothetical protein